MAKSHLYVRFRGFFFRNSYKWMHPAKHTNNMHKCTSIPQCTATPFCCQQLAAPLLHHGSFWVISPVLSLSLTDTFPSCDALPLFKNVAQRRPHERLPHVASKPKGWRKIPADTDLGYVSKVIATTGRRGRKTTEGLTRSQETMRAEVNVPRSHPGVFFFGLSQSWHVTWVRLTWTWKLVDL